MACVRRRPLRWLTDGWQLDSPAAGYTVVMQSVYPCQVGHSAEEMHPHPHPPEAPPLEPGAVEAAAFFAPEPVPDDIWHELAPGGQGQGALFGATAAATAAADDVLGGMAGAAAALEEEAGQEGVPHEAFIFGPPGDPTMELALLVGGPTDAAREASLAAARMAVHYLQVGDG